MTVRAFFVYLRGSIAPLNQLITTNKKHKNMTKKLFTLFTLALLTIPLGWAGEPVTIVMSEQGWSNEATVTKVTSGDVTILFDQNTGSYPPRYYSTGLGVRIYKGNTMTVTVPEGKTISKIELSFGGGAYMGTLGSDVGSYTSKGESNPPSGTWTGSSSSVVFSNAKGTARLQRVTVTYESGSVTPTTVVAPTFSPDGGTYSSAQNVTIGCTTSGATIHYTTDGSDPTSFSDVYSTPIAISTTTTLKAIAVKSGMTDSEVATAEYTIASSGPGGVLERAMILFFFKSTATLNASTLYDGIDEGTDYVSSATNVENCYGGGSNYSNGLRISSGSNAGVFTLNLTDLVSAYGVKQIIVNARAWTGTEDGQFSIAEVGSGTKTVFGETFEDYTINVDPSEQLTTLTFQGVSGQRLIIKSITLVFEEEGAYTISKVVQPAEGGGSYG